MIEIEPGIPYKFGTPEAAVAKMIRGYRDGMVPGAASCYALVGATVRENEDRLADMPDSYVQLYETSSGRVAHAALWCAGEIYHDPTQISGVDRLPEYHHGETFMVAEFLALERRLAAEAGMAAAPAMAMVR